MDELGKLIEEAKKGLLNVSDFYKDEIYSYFMAEIYFNFIVGLILFWIPLLILFCISFTDYWQYNLDGPDRGIWRFCTLFMGVIGLILIVGSLHSYVMITHAPKVYITKEIIDTFK
jgi:hypothetical protein